MFFQFWCATCRFFMERIMRKAFASVTFCLSTKTLIFTIPFNTPLQNACALPAATEHGIDWQPLLASPVKK